jgi:hypothetical protein
MKLRLCSAMLLLPAFGFGAYYLGSNMGRIATDSPAPSVQAIDGLAVDAAALDLGEVWEQSDYIYDLVIHNQSETTAEIFDFAVSCGCVDSIEPRALSIRPGATAKARMKLNLAKRSFEERGQSKRSFNVDIQPLRKEIAKPQSAWRLHGVIRSRVTLDALSLDFGEEAVRGQPPLERKVMATVHVADSSLRARAIPDLATVRISPAKGSTSRFELGIAPRPTLPAGSFSCKLHIDLVAENGRQLPGAVLPIAGKMQAEVRALPVRLVFGPRRIGQSAEATVTLQTPVGEKWVVDHIEMESDDVSVERVAQAQIPSSQTFRVRQYIRKAGRHASKVRFFVRKESNDPVPIAMEVSYDGDAEGVLSDSKRKGSKR